mgnify:CR=1 FL=1
MAVLPTVSTWRNVLARLPCAPYSLAACCDRAKTPAETDWPEIAALYGLLERERPSAAVRVNRAFAVARAEGASAGLALLDDTVADAPYADAVRGELLEELGCAREAIDAFERAARRARNHHEAKQLLERAANLRAKGRA